MVKIAVKTRIFTAVVVGSICSLFFAEASMAKGLLIEVAQNNDVSSSNEEVTSGEFADFLRKDVINNLTPSLPAAYYEPGPVFDWVKAFDLFRQRRFKELNELFETTSKWPSVNKNGIPNLGIPEEVDFEAADFALCNEFCRQFSGSPWPFILRADFNFWYAWEARGDGYASTVTRSGWELMDERLQKALDDYLIVIKKAPNLVYAYAKAGSAAMFLGRKRMAMDLYKKALSIDPADFSTMYSLFGKSTPQWYGKDEYLMFEFARKISAKHPEYPYLKRFIAKAHEEMARRQANGDQEQIKAYFSQPQVWDEIFSIHKELLSRYPESFYVKKYLLQYALLAGRVNEVSNLIDVEDICAKSLK
jgi:tetratricopeptide (TPR) repeat protein